MLIGNLGNSKNFSQNVVSDTNVTKNRAPADVGEGMEQVAEGMWTLLVL